MTNHSDRTAAEKAQLEQAPQTLAEMLLPVSDPAHCRFLEQFRIIYEERFGPTDLTKRYTSTWPEAQQNWLLKNHPKLYFDGLPPFAKAFIRGNMRVAARDGTLDDMPDGMLELYVRGQMVLDHEKNDAGER